MIGVIEFLGIKYRCHPRGGGGSDINKYNAFVHFLDSSLRRNNSGFASCLYMRESNGPAL